MKNQRSRVKTGVGIGCAATASVVLVLLLCFPAVVPSWILPWTPAPGRRGRGRGRRCEDRRVKRVPREKRLGRGMRERSVCAVGTRGERGCGEERERVNMRCVGRRFLFYALHPHPAGNSYSIIAMRIFYFFSACAMPCESCWKQPNKNKGAPSLESHQMH